MTSHRFPVILNYLNAHVRPLIHRTSTRKYVTTKDNGLLTTAERDFYEENGYIIIKNMVEPDLMEQFKSHFVDICNGATDVGRVTLLRDKSLKHFAKGQYLYDKGSDLLWDDIFVKYCAHPKLLDYVSCFLGPDITAIHSMLFNKLPDSGKLTSTHPLHQDLYFFPIRPVERLVGVWTALEKSTKENGCLHVVPGSHRNLLQPHVHLEYDVNNGLHGVPGTDNLPRVFLEMDKGDTLLLHPLVLHGSGRNLTKGCHKAISCHYASSHCHFVDITNTPSASSCKRAKDTDKCPCSNTTNCTLSKIRNGVVRGIPGRLQAD